MNSIAGLCLSAKPHPLQENRPSASRELLNLAVRRLTRNDERYEGFDIRQCPLPAWAGISPSELDEPNYVKLRDVIAAADLVVVAAPAYFGSLSGMAKNVFDLIGHDASVELPAVTGIVVGEQADDAHRGAEQLTEVFRLLGGSLLVPVWAVAEPQRIEAAELTAKALAFGHLCAMRLHESIAQPVDR